MAGIEVRATDKQVTAAKGRLEKLQKTPNTSVVFNSIGGNTAAIPASELVLSPHTGRLMVAMLSNVKSVAVEIDGQSNTNNSIDSKSNETASIQKNIKRGTKLNPTGRRGWNGYAPLSESEEEGHDEQEAVVPQKTSTKSALTNTKNAKNVTDLKRKRAQDDSSAEEVGTGRDGAARKASAAKKRKNKP